MSTSTIALLILIFPAAGAILLAGRGWRLPRIVTVIVSPGVVWASFVATLILFSNNASGDFTYWTWIKSGSFEVPFNILIDNLSIFMCLVITGVGGLIVSYAVGYMEKEDDASYARFFTYMDVFVFSMLLLVLAGNFIFLIVGWALVGLSSYFLIGFWYHRRSAVLAARKAFVMNVIGDVGMILGTFVLFLNYHATTYAGVFTQLNVCLPGNLCTQQFHNLQDSTSIELAAFLLLVGAVAKSAQLPLHTWLPDAMEGPTPVSALIHAATMVTAGVYLVGRMHPIYDIAVYAHGAVAMVGAVTALFAATIAIVQTDIKRVLAYSTMSQIGYMFLAVGIGAYAAGFFHLLSHAFFKALLFMAAGNIIHAMHDEQDMRKYGGILQTQALGFGPAAVSDFLSRVVGPVRWEGGGAEIALTLLTMILAAALFVWALRMRPWTAYAPWAQRLLERKYYVDEIYDAVFVRPLDWVAGFLQRDVERPVIDAAVVDTGALARWSAGELSLTQSGYFRNYVLVFVVGVVSIAGVLLLVRALT